MIRLLLDAAFPPDDVNQWIATMRAAGAQGCMAYIWDEQVVPDKWMSPAYCQAILDAGFFVLPVYVWGPDYPAIGHARQIMTAHGFTSGPCMGDIEAGSTPSTDYFNAWCQDLRVNGYISVAYGTATTLDTYRRYADKGYLASYIQRTLNPIPNLIAVSYDGWQYANSFNINGVDVDASITAISLIGTGVGSGDFNSSGGSDVVALSTPSGRLDLIYIGTDGHIYHRWQNTRINDLAIQNQVLGTEAGFVPGSCSAAYVDGGNTIAVFAAKADGNVWFFEFALSDGHTINDWTALGGNTVLGLPSSITGPQGPKGDTGATGPAGPQGPKGTVPPHSHNIGTTSVNV